MAMFDRRFFVTSLVGVAFAAAALPSAFAADKNLDAEEKLAVQFFKTRGIHQFLLLNKRKAHVLGINDGAIAFSAPVLVGKIKGDFALASLGATPAGLFPLAIYGPTEDSYIVYKKVGDSSYSLHPVLDITGQNRNTRIASNKVGDNRISSGCVNMRPDDYWKIAKDYVLGEPQTYTDMDGVTQTAPVLVILPEQTSVRKFFNIPADFKPAP